MCWILCDKFLKFLLSILLLFWLAPLQLKWVDYNRHKIITVTGLHYIVQKYSKAFPCVIYTLIIEQQSGVETWINKSWLRLIILNCLCSHPFRIWLLSYHILPSFNEANLFPVRDFMIWVMDQLALKVTETAKSTDFHNKILKKQADRVNIKLQVNCLL